MPNASPGVLTRHLCAASVAALLPMLLLARPAHAIDPANPPADADASSNQNAPAVPGDGADFQPAEDPDADPLNWITNLEEGYEAAREAGRPVLVYGGADWCGPCRMLRKEMAKPAVREKLAGWTLVYLDVDKLEGQPNAPAFTSIPAISLQTPGGRVVDSREGFLTGEELIDWLAKNQAEAGGKPDPDLTAAGVPDAQAVARLVAKLTGAGEWEQREAVIRRLRPHAPAAATAVVAAFVKGKLAARLAALELLQAWDAPVAEIDPWLPETVTDERLKALADWATRREAEDNTAAADDEPTTKPAEEEITDKQRADAGREMDRLLLEETGDVAARSIVERLSRLGPGLLPDVYDRLRRVATDRQRQRLTSLRYRLVASDERALRWSAGLDRLSSPDSATRHAAAGELAKKAAPDDAALLMELFGDPDPLVREISLRGLRALGGGDAATAMARLLDDPTINVRAAVLKELAGAAKDNPEPDVAAHVIAYAAREADPDLLVHAVRFLREAGGDEAVEALVVQLANPSWRVRAEAAEALGQKLADREAPMGNLSRASAVAALTKLLDDPDGFVVSRAVLGLKNVSGDTAKLTERLAASAEKHPDIAPEVVKALAEIGSTAAGHLRAFCAHADERVRAAAIGGLCTVDPDGASAELTATLADPSERVRLAATDALFDVLEGKRPDDRVVTTTPVRIFGGGTPKKVRPDANKWLESFRSGPGRPQWLDGLLDEVERNLAGQDAELRLRAAAVLVAAGRDDLGLPVLRNAAADVPTTRGTVAAVLPWLPWDARRALFDELLTLGLNEGQLQQLALSVAALPDARAADLLWGLLDRPEAGTTLAQAVFEALRGTYLGEQYYNESQVSTGAYEAAAEASKARLAGGNELQRLIALALMVTVAPDDAGAGAKAIYQDAATSEPLRRDAFQVMLTTLPATEARDAAAAALAAPGGDAAARRLALAYLAVGDDSLGALRDSIYVHSNRNVAGFSGEFPPPPPLPPSLKPAALEPFVAEGAKPGASGDAAQSAAYASYLLTRLDRDNTVRRMGPLLRYWRQHKQDYGPWKRLVYRAVAAANDDALTPVLAEVFETFDKGDYDLKEFYWTIRTMKGPNVLALRKRIRDEVGMEVLR